MKYPTCWVINTGKPRIGLFLVFYPKAIQLTSEFIGGIIRQACRSSTIAEKILIPGDNEACRYISNGHGECFCTEDRCNTEEFLDDFIQNYEDGILECIGGTCVDSDTVCYISGSGKSSGKYWYVSAYMAALAQVAAF